MEVRMRRIGLVVVVGLVLVACSSAMSRDIDTPTELANTSVELASDQLSMGVPDQVDLFYNLDTHPNIVRLCIDGVAIMTTSREFEPVQRVPEWDAYCASQIAG